jgi:hypothetical protein
MKLNQRKLSGIFLISGMLFLALGFSINNTIFSWLAVACVLVSLVLGGRWMRPRRK